MKSKSESPRQKPRRLSWSTQFMWYIVRAWRKWPSKLESPRPIYFLFGMLKPVVICPLHSCSKRTNLHVYSINSILKLYPQFLLSIRIKRCARSRSDKRCRRHASCDFSVSRASSTRATSTWRHKISLSRSPTKNQDVSAGNLFCLFVC